MAQHIVCDAVQLRTATMRQQVGQERLSSRRPRQAHNPAPNATGASTSSSCSTAGYDLVLSSGFLAFAAHCGFLQAVEEVGLPVRGVMGTSSGALVGSMFCAGIAPSEIAKEFSRQPPIQRVSVSRTPWSGVLTMRPVVRILKEMLPPAFEDLDREFAVGVVGSAGHELVASGSLPEAVVASAAVPVLFAPVHVPGLEHGPYIDGGVECRIGLDIWRRNRRPWLADQGPDPAVVHLIGRSSPFSGNDAIDELGAQRAAVVCSPKSKASMWDLSGFHEQFIAARDRALPVLEKVLASEGAARMGRRLAL